MYLSYCKNQICSKNPDNVVIRHIKNHDNEIISFHSSAEHCFSLVEVFLTELKSTYFSVLF